MEFTIFDKPSGSLRGMGTQMMSFPKGKSGFIEKRICHAYVFETDPLDYVSVDVPKRLTPDQMREVAAKLVQFADEVEHQYAVPRGAMTFHQVTESYERILAANPGKGLVTHDGNHRFIAFMQDGSLTGGEREEDGTVKLESLFEFDPRAWKCDEGRWDCDDSWEVTVGAIHQPTLVDFKLDAYS